MKNPKVFISHASEDKERFVLDFAAKLRSSGIDAWVDIWELKLGDSIVDAIFEGGMKEADIVIIILSAISITKPWVREEINISFVNKVSGNKRLMPVLIDDCDVPECLKATLWIRIKDLSNYDNELDRIKLNILGKTNKPELGDMPKYAQNPITIINGLSEIDSLVLKTACELSIEKNYNGINSYDLFKKLKPVGINEDTLLDSLQILEEDYYIHKCVRTREGGIALFFITINGYNDYAKANIDDFIEIIEKVKYYVVNNERATNEEISKSLKVPNMLVMNVLNELELDGLIKPIRFQDGMIISTVSPKLKRLLE